MTGPTEPMASEPQARFLSSRSQPVTDRLSLPARLDSQAAGQLFDALGARRGGPLVINVESVAYLGALALQVLLAARRQWDADAQPLTIAPPDAPFFELAAQLGVAPDRLRDAVVEGSQ